MVMVGAGFVDSTGRGVLEAGESAVLHTSAVDPAKPSIAIKSWEKRVPMNPRDGRIYRWPHHLSMMVFGE
jgi:hypothetical protein